MEYQRFLRPFYIFNFLLILVYPALRMFIFSFRLAQTDTYGYTREGGILFSSFTLLFLQWRKSSTPDQFFASIFWIGKISHLVLLYFFNIKWVIYYAGACVVVYLFFRQPKYSGPSKIIPLMTERLFDDAVNKPFQGKLRNPNLSQRSYEDMNMWLVEFYVDWAETCIYTKPLWAEFSNKYSTGNFKFAEVNLSMVPELALRYNINTSAVSRQLPTLIMFEDGKEVERFPPFDDEKKKYYKVIKYEKKALLKYFDLQKRYLATRDIRKETPQTVPKTVPKAANNDSDDD